MISQCPYCHKKLNLSQAQSEKLRQALKALDGDQLLTIKCPFCKEPMTVDSSGQIKLEAGKVQPPTPPNLDWLKTGLFKGEDKIEDVPMALIVHKSTAQRDSICASIESVGYQTIVSESVQDAIERMRFVNFACVVYQSDYEGEDLDKSTFHDYLRAMSMDRRRYIFYILIGPHFTTLYDIEALSASANLVINTGDLKHLNIILRKSIPEYEELFGPILEELGSYGKR